MFQKDRRSYNPHYLFSLMPIRQLKFKLYEDIKYPISATINNPELIDLVKAYFMRILSYKLRGYFSQTKQVQLPKIMVNQMTEGQDQRASKYIPDEFIKYLGLGGASVIPVNVFVAEKKSQADQSELGFLDRLNQGAPRHDQKSVASSIGMLHLTSPSR